MNIIVITCPQLFSKRLPTLFESIYKLKLENFIDDLHVINIDDELLKQMCILKYNPSKWENDINKGWPAFYYNIYNIARKQSNQSSATFASDDFHINAERQRQIFRSRPLSEQELSIAMRHIYSWKLAARSPIPTLILEDDAIFESFDSAAKLDVIASKHSKHHCFIDCSDSYIPKNRNGETKEDFSYSNKPITRTLNAYLITNSLAAKLCESDNHLALPIDMHLQVKLLEVDQIISISSNIGIVRHGSKDGTFKSHIN